MSISDTESAASRTLESATPPVADYVDGEYVPPEDGWEVVSGGCTAIVERQFGSDWVVKQPYPNSYHPASTIRELRREFDIYQRLPRHPRLLTLLPGGTPTRLVLPFVSHGTLKDRLEPDAAPLPCSQRLQFAANADEAIGVLHSANVIHCDIQLHNFMVDSDDRLRVIDFAGSMLDGQVGTATEGKSYFLPRPFEEPSSERTDIFALDSLLYAILSGRPPYNDKPEEEVSRLFSEGIFPPTDHLVYGDVILNCWTGAYTSANDAYQAISRDRRTSFLDATPRATVSPGPEIL